MDTARHSNGRLLYGGDDDEEVSDVGYAVEQVGSAPTQIRVRKVAWRENVDDERRLKERGCIAHGAYWVRIERQSPSGWRTNPNRPPIGPATGRKGCSADMAAW